MKKIGVLTSGGDAPGMNAAICAIAQTCAHHSIKLIGIEEGFSGLATGKILSSLPTDLVSMINQGGTLLKTSRFPQFLSETVQKQSAAILKQQKIDGLIVIGGDGSMQGANCLSRFYSGAIVGIPGTIDNDMTGTDFSIGFDTALNTVLNVLDKVRNTAISHNQLFLAEVMGRQSGAIAMHAAIACGADGVIIPEDKSGMTQLTDTLKKRYNSGKSAHLIVIAEGALAQYKKAGNRCPLGLSYFADQLKQNIPELEPRTIILGHQQRGGSPSCFDRVLACQLGAHAVTELIQGRSANMVGLINNKVVTTKLNQITSGSNHLYKTLSNTFRLMST